MNEMTISFNGEDYVAIYNPQTGYYEIDIEAPDIGGVYQADITFTDIFEYEYTDSLSVQVLVKEQIKIETNKVFMWIFDYYSFSIKDIIEIADYEINIDEETNAKSIIKVLKKTDASAKDIIAVKRNNEIIYWGIIDEIQNEAGKQLYEYSTKYITNLFDEKVPLRENLNSEHIPEGYYNIHFVTDPNYVLDIKEGSAEGKAIVCIYEKNNRNSQKFQVINKTDYIQLKNINSGKNIDVPYANFQNGTIIEQYTPNESDSQQFNIVKISDYIYAIKCANHNYALDVAYNLAQNETNIQLYDYAVTDIAEYFIFERLYELDIQNIGIEDFIANTIKRNFTESEDTFKNLDYLEIEVKTHTPLQTSVTNVEDGIYNLHTWMTNCTQLYNITFEFSIVENKLHLIIENKSLTKQLIDTKAQAISNYLEVFQTNVISNVTVLTKTKTYNLYLLNDRTTTTDMTDINRAKGLSTTVYVDEYEQANQKALDVMKANSYNHNITFNYYDKFIPVGTPIAIKTKESSIYDTYISSIKITPKKFYEYTCGNIRIKFIDKLLKERSK